MLHDVAAATERCGGQAAGDDFAKGGQVARDVVHAVPAGVGGAEARHHLVEDQQGAIEVGELLKLGVEVVLRGDGAHVARGRLGDYCRDLALILAEGAFHCSDIVVRHHDRVLRLCAGDSRGVRQRKCGEAGAGGREQRIHVAVVAALELDDLRPARESAREADCGHGGLGAGVDHAHLLHRGALHDVLGDPDLRLRGGAKAQAIVQGLLHRLHDLRVRVAVHHRAPGAHEVDVGVAVHVDELGAVRALDEAGLPAHRPEAAHR